MNILIRNGLVFSNGDSFLPGDVLTGDGVVLEVGADIKHGAKPDCVVDAAGCIVSPGLIDFHCHLVHDASEHGCYADLAAIPNGVTTMVDAGTAGSASYEGFRRLVVHNSRVNVFSSLNVSPTGMVSLAIAEIVDPDLFDRKKIARLLAMYPGEIFALKIRLARKVLRNWGEEPLIAALELARDLGVIAVVHVSESPVPCGRTLNLLGKGDVFCHCFTDKDCLILDDSGRVRPEAVEARKRGVLFDMANGTHMALEVARQAIQQGFWPDIVSTDETFVSMYMDPVMSLPYVMTKMYALGMPLEAVFRAATLAPAAALGRREELGTLAPGTRADIGVFRIADHGLSFSDHAGGSMIADKIIQPLMTLKDGKILYRNICF